jgi:hypothetical protein
MCVFLLVTPVLSQVSDQSNALRTGVTNRNIHIRMVTYLAYDRPSLTGTHTYDWSLTWLMTGVTNRNTHIRLTNRMCVFLLVTPVLSQVSDQSHVCVPVSEGLF